jgi:hypothetical protein
MFDLRYAPNGAKGIKRHENPIIANCDTTRPYLTFPDYLPLPEPTLDISPGLGLLATRMSLDHHISLSLYYIHISCSLMFILASRDNTIQLFSLRTGQQVPSPLSEHQYSSNPSCVAFEAGNDVPAWKGPDTLSMLVGIDGIVDQWSW